VSPLKGAGRRFRARLRRPGGVLLTVVLVLAVGLAVATATEPEPRSAAATARDAAPRQVSVARASGACPAPVADATTTTRVSLAGSGPIGPARGATGSRGAPGEATLTDPAAPAAPLVRIRAPGSGAADAGPDTGPLLVRGSDRSAPGLVAAQVTRSTNATMRGLAGTTCAASGTDFWFVGSGAVVGQRGRVYLTNPEPAPAVVDVDLYGPDGPISAPDARGITVAAGEQEVRLLDALAPGITRFALHVHVRQGRVSAAVRDLQVAGLTPLGADWVPTAAPPARRQVIPGVPGGEGLSLLRLVAPGDSDAIVRVRLISDAGAFAPAGLDVIEVPAGSVSEVDIAEYTGGEAVSVELDSDAPVTAGVLTRLVAPAGKLGDIAYASAATALTPATPGVVADARIAEGVTSRLLLTAPGEEATVQLAPLPPATGEPVEVVVPAGSQASVDLASVSTAADFALTVRPRAGSGPVLAVRQIDEAEARGPMVTTSPVDPGRYVVPVPRVVADLSTGLRSGGG